MKAFTSTKMVNAGLMSAVVLVMLAGADQSWAQPQRLPSGFHGSSSSSSFRRDYHDRDYHDRYRDHDRAWRGRDNDRDWRYQSNDRDWRYRSNDRGPQVRYIQTPQGIRKVYVSAPVRPVVRPAVLPAPVPHHWVHRDFRSIEEARAFAVGLHLPKLQIKAYKAGGTFHIDYWRN